jgi:NitT/TauT family transport system ATP-binding protein
MITLDHVAFAYPGKAPVLADVSLHLAPGAMVCLFGPSGCGKSTTLDLVAGLRTPQQGTRQVGSRRLGYAFQEPRLLPWRSVVDNVRIGIRGWLNCAEAAAAANEWLGRLDLSEANAKRPAELSGGMRRRVNLARAFALRPDILLLDEPFAFLDDHACRRVADGIRDLNQAGAAVLMVSHVRDWAEVLGCRIVEVSAAPLRMATPPTLA